MGFIKKKLTTISWCCPTFLLDSFATWSEVKNMKISSYEFYMVHVQM